MNKKFLCLKTLAALLMLAITIFAAFHTAHAEQVLTKGGAVVLLDWNRRGSATNIANFTRSAVLRVVAPDGTNQFGIDTNCTPFIVQGGVSNATGISVVFTNVVGGGGASGTIRLQFWKGILVSTNG